MEEATLEKHIKKTTITSNIVSLVVALFVGLGTGYGFYYNTNSTLKIHTEQIQEIQKDVTHITESVNSTAVFQGASKEQIKALENNVSDVKKSQERIEDKLDRLILKSND